MTHPDRSTSGIRHLHLVPDLTPEQRETSESPARLDLARPGFPRALTSTVLTVFQLRDPAARTTRLLDEAVIPHFNTNDLERKIQVICCHILQAVSIMENPNDTDSMKALERILKSQISENHEDANRIRNDLTSLTTLAESVKHHDSIVHDILKTAVDLKNEIAEKLEMLKRGKLQTPYDVITLTELIRNRSDYPDEILIAEAVLLVMIDLVNTPPF